MSIAGTYVLTTNENYGSWMNAMGLPSDIIARMEAAKPTLEVTQNGNDLSVKTIAGDKNFTNTITLGKDSKAGIPGGLSYTVNLTNNGNVLTGTYCMEGKAGTATVTFTAQGITQCMTYEGVTAKRTYTRQ